MIGTQVGPYRIIREIGSGGMGAVYFAVRVDEQYVQAVAMKFIARGMDSPDAIARFRVERQVLAALQHPNIAMLLDGGADPEGRPYIVMEYIEGKPLLEYCRENDLPVERRLQLFCDLCSAVHHAHQMLVIHRDIKPGNVLVTADGIPKLLDFGIAKMLTPELVPGEEAVTLTVARRLTPRYASPEQIMGAQVTTATDVYSLGVLLYELLTYASPYRTTTASEAEIERAVCEQEPTRLSKAPQVDPRVRKQLSGDLENIVAMALRKDVQRRYSSAQQLAEDVGRYLKGLPVIAREDTVFYLAGKLVRRNLLASAAFTALVVSVAVGWTSTILQARRTDARFQQVRGLANTIVRDFPPVLHTLPGSGPVRAELVRTALEYLDKLSKDAGNDLGLQFELAQAYDRVGDVQGDPQGPNLGQYKEAIASYKQSLQLSEQVAKRRRDWPVLNAITWLHLKIGDLQWRAGDSVNAFANYKSALDLAAEIKRDLKDVRVYKLEAECYERFARALTASRRLDEALENARSGKAAAMEFVKSEIGPRASNTLATSEMVYGDVLGVTGRMEESRQAYEDAVMRLERVVQGQPGDWGVIEDLADAYRRLGDLLGAPTYFHFGEPEQAEIYLRKALELEQRMSEHDPESAQRRARLSLAFRRLASVQRERKPEIAVVSYKRAIEIGSELLNGSPSDINYQRELAVHREVYAQALQQMQQFESARAELDTAMSVQRTLVQQLPNRNIIHEDLFHSLIALGELQFAMKQGQAGMDSFTEALAIARRLAEKDSRYLYAQRCVAEALEKLANGHSRFAAQTKGTERSEHLAKAEACLGEMESIWSKWRVDGVAIPYIEQQKRYVARLPHGLRTSN